MNLHFHHIGVACRDIESETNRLAALGYTPEGSEFLDPIQGVLGRFVHGGGPRLELLAPVASEGVLSPWLKAGVKLYHLAHEVVDLEQGIAHLRAQGAKVVVKPVPAVAFEGRRVVFLMLPNLLLTELIQTR